MQLGFCKQLCRYKLNTVMQVKPSIPELFAVFLTEKTFYDLTVFLSDFCVNMMNGCISFAGLGYKQQL